MSRLLARLATAVLVVALAIAVSHAGEKLSTKKGSSFYWKLHEVNGFVRDHSDYKSLALPRVVFLSKERLEALCGHGLGTQACATEGVIFLRDDFVLGRDDYILAHELTHFQQWESGREFACSAAREPEAYAMQDKWIAAHGGVGEKSDAFTVLMLSQCFAIY